MRVGFQGPKGIRFTQSDLAAVLEAKRRSPPVITSADAGKKSPPKPATLLGPAALAAAVTLAVVVLAALWWALGRGGPPRDERLAKANPAPSAKAGGGVSSEATESSKEKAPIAVSPGPSEGSVGNAIQGVPQSAPESAAKPPEPNAGEAAKSEIAADHVIRPETTAEAKPAVSDPAAQTPAPEEKAPVKGLEPPSADEQKRLGREIDEIYKLGEAKDPTAKTALARKMLEDGQKDEGKRAEQFVLLRRAGEVACDAGESDLMLQAVDAMAAASFEIQPIQVKSRLLKRLVDQGSLGGAEQLSSFSASCVKVAEEAAANDAAGEASSLLNAAGEALAERKKETQKTWRAARVAMGRARNPADKTAWGKKGAEAQAELDLIDGAQSVVADCAKGLQDARQEQETLQAMQERLKAAPDDPDACLTLGRFYCFSRDEWDEGLKLLAKGSDPALKSLATMELASSPAKAEEKVARGDRWWDLAENAAGGFKSAMRRRAGYWYQEAGPLASVRHWR